MIQIDSVNLSKLKNVIYYDDKPMHLTKILKGLESFYNWNELIDATRSANTCSSIRCMNWAKEESEFDEFEILDIKDSEERLAKLAYAYDNLYTISCTHWERKNEASKKLVDFISNIFHDDLADLDCFATSHLFLGSTFSRSFDPHCDIPTNLIFQIHGRSKYIVYENRCSAIMNVNTVANSLRKHKIHDAEMKVLFEGVLEPGDCLYIPARQYHYIEPMEARVSLSVPICFGEDWYEFKKDTTIIDKLPL